MRIKWAPKVAQGPVARLYEADAAGIHDEMLVDEVGYALWERAYDIALVKRAGVRCPADGSEFATADTCPTCGWRTTVEAWRDSWRKTDLHGFAPYIDEYLAKWPQARTYRDRMLLIDRLIHEVHATGGNLVRALIEGGRRNSPHAFLDRLAYGEQSTVDHEARATFSETRLNRSRRRS